MSIKVSRSLTLLVYLIKLTSFLAEYPLQIDCNFIMYNKFLLNISSLSYILDITFLIHYRLATI